MTEDDYWERVRDMRKDDWILFDERYTPKEETQPNGAPYANSNTYQT